MLSNFLILGAPKCGTTTLYEILRARGDIFMSANKDPLFFELGEEYECGPEFYREEYFSQWSGQPVVGEARAAKLMLPFAPARIHQILPDARLVVIVRDPVDRLTSHWWMRTCNGKEGRPPPRTAANSRAVPDALGAVSSSASGATSLRSRSSRVGAFPPNDSLPSPSSTVLCPDPPPSRV